MRILCRMAGITVLAVTILNSPVLAQLAETGIAQIHEWKKVGKKTCIADHWHYGNGDAADRAKALAAAVRNWEQFTDLDYGTVWGKYRLAEARTTKCEKADQGPGWKCLVGGRACRPN